MDSNHSSFETKIFLLQIDDLNSKSAPISIFNGVGYVPIDPTFNNVFTMTHDGQLITSVAMDFASHVPAIIRMLPSNQVLKTDTNWDRWLNRKFTMK